MFQIIDKNTVRNSSGFVVKLASVPELIGIHEVQYVDENRLITVEVESGQDDKGKFLLIVYSKTFKVKTLSCDIDTEDKNKIIKNISDGLRFLGITHIVE